MYERSAELRRQEVAALRAIDPACETEDDPPVVWRAPARMGGEPNGVLLDLPRLSGRGKPGSRLVIAERDYDGCGPNGGEAHDYVTLFARFRDFGGYERRSVGVAVHAGELDQVIDTLVKYRDELDARRGPRHLTPSCVALQRRHVRRSEHPLREGHEGQGREGPREPRETDGREDHPGGRYQDAPRRGLQGRRGEGRTMNQQAAHANARRQAESRL